MSKGKKMSDSDEYEVMEDQKFSPPCALPMFVKQRSNTHLGFARNRSPIGCDIDSRPPYPTPKSSQSVSTKVRSPIFTTESDHLTYDRITLSPVAPDYEYTSYPSTSPPRGSNGYNLTRHNMAPPPLPPANPNRRPVPGRSLSETSDQLSQTPPRSNTLPAHANQLVNSGHYAAPNTRMVSYAKHKRSSSHEFEAGTSPPSRESTLNPTYNSQLSSKPLSGSNDCLLNGSRPESYIRDSAEMPLRVFAEKYKADLPLKVIVTKGFYGADERTSISERDMFNIHFFKQTKVVKIQDTSNYQYTVPLNSALEFGLLYTLPPGFKQPDSKYHFRTAKELMALKELPKVVRVTQAFRGSGPDSSVEQHDLLLLKEIKQKRGIKSSKILKAIHASSGATKMLPEDCCGNFSVRPQDVRLFLPEIVKHIDLPQKAICNYGGGKVDLPAHIISSEVTILNMQIEESIVATSILEDEATPSNQHYENTPSIPLVDIPTDLDIELAIIKLAEIDEDQLYLETRHVFERFNPADASYLNLKNSVTASAQTSLFRAIRQDQNQQIGIELLRPKNAFHENSNLSLNRLSNSSDSSRRLLGTPSECVNTEEVFDKLNLLSSNASSLESRLNSFELKLQTLDRHSPILEEQRREIGAVKADVGVVREDCSEFRKSIGDVKDSISQLTDTTSKLSIAIESIQSEIKLIQQERHLVGNGSLPNGLVNGKNGHNEEHNIHSIQQLDHTQVLQLLNSLKLTQYKEMFINEEITGEILAELNEADLQNELGITSKIHRVKLMKVISGRYSALNVLRGEDPYYVHLTQSS